MIGGTSTIRPPRRDGFPAGPSLLGSTRWLTSFFDDPVEWYTRLRLEYGDIVGLRVGPISMIVCSDPATLERLLVKEPRDFCKGNGLRATRFVLGNGLITSDGELHRRHRKLAAPVFTPRNIEPFAAATVAIASEMLDAWPASGTVHAARDCYDVSLRVAGVGLFGTDFNADEREALHVAMRDLDGGYRLAVSPGGSTAYRFGLMAKARRARRGRDHVDRVIRGLIAQRRAVGDAQRLGDLLSRLLAARDEDDETSFSDEAVTMLLAGHDTTAATLGWCLALQELVIVLAAVLQRYELATTPGFRLEPHVGFIRRPAGSLPLTVPRRPSVPPNGRLTGAGATPMPWLPWSADAMGGPGFRDGDEERRECLRARRRHRGGGTRAAPAGVVDSPAPQRIPLGERASARHHA